MQYEHQGGLGYGGCWDYSPFATSLHFLSYTVIDQFFDWDGIAKDIIKRPYITVGFPAFLLLIPLALISADAVKNIGLLVL